MEAAKLKHILGSETTDADDPGLNADAKVKLLAVLAVAKNEDTEHWGRALAQAIEKKVDLSDFRDLLLLAEKIPDLIAALSALSVRVDALKAQVDTL